MEMEMSYHRNVSRESPEPTVILEERIEELTSTTYPSDPEDGRSDGEGEMDQLKFGGETENPLRVPFPELGLDLVDSSVYEFESEHLDGDQTVKVVEVSTWEENWLFQKKRKKDCDISEVFAYNNLNLADGPNLMLIPNPSQPVAPVVGTRDVDELSDLSERNSVGSLSFSESEVSEDIDEEDDYTEEVNEISKSCGDTENKDSAVSVGTINTDSEADKVSNKSLQETLKTKRKTKIDKKAICIKAVPKSVPVPSFVPSQQRQSDTIESEDPSFVFPPGSASVQPGILVQFCCRVKGSPPLGVAWFKDDLRLADSEDFRIVSSGRDHILEIKCTKFELQGNYSCVVFNHIDKKWSDFSLYVRTQPLKRPEKAPLRKKVDVKKQTVESSPPLKEPPPEIIQRTWAERIAEEEKGKQQTERRSVESDAPLLHPPSPPPVDLIIIPPTASGTIAEREHKKWEESAVEWPDNPYTKENIEKRAILNCLSADSAADTSSVPEESEEEMSYPVIITASKDLTRHRRDYYIPQSSKEETLNGFEEKVYSSSKYFPVKYKPKSNGVDSGHDKDEKEELETSSSTVSVKELVGKFSGDESRQGNRVRRRSTFSFNTASNQKSLNGISCKLNHVNVNHKVPFRICTWDTRGSPSLGFCSCSVQACPLFRCVSAENVPKDETKSVSQNVHSLTGRTFTKEFREQTIKNLPRTTITHPVMLSHSKSLQEIDKYTEGNSSSSETNATCSPTNEGYVSDESNSSCLNKSEAQVTAVKLKHPRKASRSILERASFWEKRCEQGLISDTSVNEDFPEMEHVHQ